MGLHLERKEEKCLRNSRGKHRLCSLWGTEEERAPRGDGTGRGGEPREREENLPREGRG